MRSSNLKQNHFFCLYKNKDSTYFKTFESTLGSTVSAVKSKITPSKSAMNFNDSSEHDELNGASGSSMSQSATHDDHLNFGGESKK